MQKPRPSKHNIEQSVYSFKKLREIIDKNPDVQIHAKKQARKF